MNNWQWRFGGRQPYLNETPKALYQNCKLSIKSNTWKETKKVEEFRILVDNKEYVMEYTRDSVLQFEAIGGSISGMQDKIFTSINDLTYVGLLKHHLGINYNLAKKISDAAIEEYGASEIYPILAEKFTEVFMQEGASGKKKSFLISEINSQKKTSNLEK